MRILGIETSCDDTGIAVYDAQKGLIAHALSSQVDIHQPFGGVFPELASRDHVRKTLPLIQSVLSQIPPHPAMTAPVSAIAYTAGPGLIGSLLVGATLGRTLAFAWHIPAIAVHHMEGHLLAPMLEPDPPEFPFLALLVSGGHTLLVHVQAMGQYHILGQTLDDAAGEAFDKVAKLLGLPYPGGPEIARYATYGDATRFHFTRPMIHHPNTDFSFSGLKTQVTQTWKQYHQDCADLEQLKADIAIGFEAAVIDILLNKCTRALDHTGLNRLVVAGGVSANRRLRSVLSQELEPKGVRVYVARPEFCTDNGAMIAYAGYCRLRLGDQQHDLKIHARAHWPMEEIHQS